MIRRCERHNQKMARAVCSGTLSFGRVSVPVRLSPATRRQDIRFHEIDRSSGQRIRHQKVVEAAPAAPPPTPPLPRRGGGGVFPPPSSSAPPPRSGGGG